jgi:CubicO group peptidase (beta-lactamase class C family)
MKNRILLLLFTLTLALFSPITAAAAASNNTYTEIDAYLQRSVERAKLPGMSVIIVDKSKVLFSATYGNCSSLNTPFIIGSTSKSFTAVSIMQLVEQGKINIDNKLSDYLPEVTVGDKITVRQLLNQTSGLGEYQRLYDVKITSSYGTHQYANVNYSLLGKMIERVSGMSYEQYVTEHIFNPLAMKHSAASLTKSKENGLIKGYRNFFGIPVSGEPDYPVENSWGQVSTGYISSSASDMGKYLQMYLNGGGQVLTQESIDTVFYSNVLADPSESYYYGMGWSLSKKYKEPILAHSGLVENYMSDMFILPERGIGVMLLSNTNDYLVADSMFDSISDSIALLLMGASPIEISTTKYLQSHLLLDALYLAILLIALLPLLLLKRYKRSLTKLKAGRVVITTGLLHVLFPTALLVLPGILITPLWVIRLYVPDLFYTLVAGAVLLYLGGVIKVFLFIYNRKSIWKNNNQP